MGIIARLKRLWALSEEPKYYTASQSPVSDIYHTPGTVTYSVPTGSATIVEAYPLESFEEDNAESSEQPPADRTNQEG